MTITNSNSRIAYTGNGVTVAFSFPYAFDSQDDLVVLLAVAATGVETVQTITTHYTISGTVDSLGRYPTGGTITFVTAPPSTVSATIYRDPEALQELDLPGNGLLPSEPLEAELDYLTMLAQRTRDIADRSLRLSEGETSTDAKTVLPFNRASKYLAFGSVKELVAVDAATASGTSVLATGSTTARLLADRAADWFNALDHGIVADDATDNTAAIIAMFALMTNGGIAYFPKGTYRYHRGTGALLANTIVSNNVTVMGDGPGTIFNGRNGAGNISNDTCNQYYNLFQAEGQSGLTFRDFAFKEYGTAMLLLDCTNILVDHVQVNGALTNAGLYLSDKGIYFDGCENALVTGCYFINCLFAVYIGVFDAAATVSTHIRVIGNHFEHTLAGGSYTALFPVGVYVYIADNTLVEGNTFKNIYSSVDNGNSGTGLGYGVYEGDGSSNMMIVTGNTFLCESKGLKRWNPILLSRTLQGIISNNTIRGEGVCKMLYGIRIGSNVSNMHITVSGNNIYNEDTTLGGAITIDSGPALTNNLTHVTGNQLSGVGWINGIVAIGLAGTLRAGQLLVEGNSFDQIGGPQISMFGVVGGPIARPTIRNNIHFRSLTSAIQINGYTVGAIIENNTCMDGNTSATAGDAGAAIILTSFSHGCRIVGNTIGNTIAGGGLYTAAMSQANNESSRIFKDIICNNTTVGINSAAPFSTRLATTIPPTTFFDIEDGEIVYATQTNSGTVLGWRCIEQSFQVLNGNASSASTTVVVVSTSNYAIGDSILITKTNDPITTADYADTADWHATTVASVTNATDFVVTDAIPAGDGTYTSGTAWVKRARWGIIPGSAATASATYDPPSLADGVGTTTTVTCKGAALGMFVAASFSLDTSGITITAWVSATDTVSVRFQNESGGVLDIASGTLRVSARNLV